MISLTAIPFPQLFDATLFRQKSRRRAFNQRFNIPHIYYLNMAGKTAVDTLREKLQAGDRGGSDADRGLLLAFSDELKLRREEYGWHRHEKLLRHNTRASEHADVELVESILSERGDDDFEAAKDAAKVVVRWIHDTYDIAEGSQETNRDYRVAFRMLAKHTTRGEDIPDTHEWISTQTTRDYQPEPDEADMLEWGAHVRPMIDACHNDRDRALIALQFEGGFRGGELHDLTLDQISDSEHSIKVRVDGKRANTTSTSSGRSRGSLAGRPSTPATERTTSGATSASRNASATNSS